MAIFGVIEAEPKVQIDDKTRISASKSFVSKDESAITLIEIEPEAASGFINVTDVSARELYLDWSYSGTSRDVVATLRITTDGAPVTFTKTISIVTAADDKLFSTDADIINKEADILKWVQDGRASFLNVHRQSQDLIMAYLDEAGFVDNQGARLTIDAIVDTEEVRQWSAAMTLRLIFQSISNAVDDVFSANAIIYESQEKRHKDRAYFRFDVNGDGIIESTEYDSFQTITFRRD